jgi:hypothetical protein
VYDYYPGIDISPSGNIGMSFMQSSHTGTNTGQFMSVYVTGRGPGDTAGSMETPVLVQAGQANYTDFANPHRAGDLSGINVDADGSFWAANEFATSGTNDNWSTAIGHFILGPQITTVTLANWTVNQPGYSQTLTTTGGTGTVTFTETGTFPPGLTLSTAGVISGMPTATGSYTFTVTATDSVGASGSRSYTVVINPVVTITTPSSATWTAGLAFSQAVNAVGGTGAKTFSTPAANLPPGITLAAGGSLTGTPTTAGSYSFTITATDAVGATGTQNYTMVVNPPVAVNTTSLPNWTVNAANYSVTFSASGGTGTLNFSASGTPPTGLTLTTTGVLSGTPTAAGSYTFSITATDSLGASAGRTHTVTINPAVSISPGSLPASTVNVAYNQTIAAAGGTSTLALAVSNINGAIPGLNVPTSGSGNLVIGGTPTAAGTETFTVTATDGVGATASQDYSVVVNSTVAITTTSLPNWTANLSGYSQTINAVGGTGTITFSLSAGTLPSGLTLSTAGILSGTPTTAGSFTFTVTATDSVGGSAGQGYTVIINPVVTVTTTTLPTWTASFAGYNQTIAATGGTGSLAFSSTGTLPGGLMFSSGGVLSGTPTTAGSFTFTVTATDTLGASGSQGFTLVINPAITFNPGVLPSDTVNVSYNKTIVASGGTGTVTLAVTNLANPIPGLNVPSGGTGSIAITGTPTATGTETFTLTAVDSLGASATTNYSITVNPSTVFLSMPSSGFAGSPGGTISGFPININELQDETSTNHVGLKSATFAMSFPVGVFAFPTGTGAANPYVSLGSVPLSDTASPGGALDWTLSATSPADGQLNITLTAKGGDNITTDNPANGGSLVLINFPVSSSYQPDAPTDQPITIVSSRGVTHTSIIGNNGTYVLNPPPPYSGSVTVNPAGTGVFSQYLVNVVGSSTVHAGNSFLVAVQAADSFGNAVTTYSGPATVTASITPTLSPGGHSNFPVTVSMNASGLGLFLGNIQQVGSYTITASSGSLTGTTTSSVNVAPGLAATLAFLAQPQDTPTSVALPTVSVEVLDQYGNVVTSDNSDSVALKVANGPGGFTPGSTTTATVSNGVASFSNLTLAVPGSYVLSAQVPFLYTGPPSGPFSIAPLQVAAGSFVGTPSGFLLQFNAPYLVNSLTPVLYGSGFGATGTAPSVILTTDPGHLNNTGAYVGGSLVLDRADNRITFLATTTAEFTNSKLGGGTASPLLPDGVYTAVIRSSAATDGFQALDSGGGFLDGLGTGKPGSGDFMATFTVNAAAAHDDIVWVPPTADGPGQPLSAPGKNAVGGGFPIYLSDTTGTVTDVQVTLNYNSTLLTVTGVSGAGFTLSASSTPGQAVLQYSGPALATGAQTPIGYLLGTVPSGSSADPVPYRAKDLLHLSNVLLNGDPSIPVTTGDALHLVSYVADADGNGSYSNNDAVLITRALLGTDSGFSAYPLVDPIIVADTDGSGFIPADAALQANNAGTGLPSATLATPPIPPGVVFVPIGNNVDPSISIPSVLHAAADGTVSVPVNIDDAHPAGSTGLIAGHLALTYDPAAFTVSAADIHPGSLLASGDWTIVPIIDQTTGQIGITLSGSTPITTSASGSLVVIDFHAKYPEVAGGSIRLVGSVTPQDRYVPTELEDAQGSFTLTQALTSAAILQDPLRRDAHGFLAGLDQIFAQAAAAAGPLGAMR